MTEVQITELFTLITAIVVLINTYLTKLAHDRADEAVGLLRASNINQNPTTNPKSGPYSD